MFFETFENINTFYLYMQNYEQMLHDLSDLRREDIHRRQQIVAKIPVKIDCF